MTDSKFKKTVKMFQKLPGVGPRQAARFVLALLEKPESELQELGTSLYNLKEDIKLCPECFNLSDNGLCVVCSSHNRDKTKVLVIEKVTDLDSIEKTGLYKGLYHVLGGSINPLDGVLPEHLRIEELKQRAGKLANGLPAQAGSDLELILATNPNTAGETTALYLKDLFNGEKKIKLTRLGRGLASGSHLEYADEMTIRNALDSRK
ncbi:MAG: recombination protein RecR [Candidatus Yanofskybacteria bacterium RIFCSPLOWO2_01_FULL_49_17]|uniref:Recombination protein RecR n=1 Tax=Candidatus Yanofskybacteria bacterium RIFCSPLOWO2_01_FULL_49_17 TaxID=1802700 RepID=A0A1F8GRW6_9BACT|nr:MAG: recombination protein RecR [Candidatus Yanofskybacteria bacterium RIFCSPLOWO2_01_FULL_49_17]